MVTEYCLIIEKGIIKLGASNLELLSKLNRISNDLASWQVKEFSINASAETLVIAYEDQNDNYCHLLSLNNPFTTVTARSMFRHSDNQWLVGDYSIDNDLPLDELIDRIEESLDVGEIQEHKNFHNDPTIPLVDILSASNNLLLPSTVFIYGTIGDQVQSLSYLEAERYRVLLKNYLSFIKTDKNFFKSSTIIADYDNKSRILYERSREFEKFKWTISEPIISDDQLPIVDLVFSGYNLDGVGKVTTAIDDWDEYTLAGNESQFYEFSYDILDINENGFKDVIDALTPSSDEPFTSLVLTFSLESNLTEWKPTSEYIIELSKEIDDMAIAKYSVRDNHSRRWEDIYLGFIFKRLFGYFPDAMLIELKEVL